MSTHQTLISLFDVLQGDRIVIRPYRGDDATDLFTAIGESRDHLRPWLPFADSHQTIDESRDWIAQQQAAWLLRTELSVGIWANNETRFVGGTELKPIDWDIRYFQIGYWLRASETGQGYATEAVRLLTEYALNHLNAQRVEIRCSDHNISSAAIARRIGFTLEGVLQNDHRACDGAIHSSLIFARIPTASSAP
ncbi:GNAT family N-acetyltransferase [Chloroflexi bacterium TSY]|nr:GNAT family N-acetyltransferase [Chloroflexi bacterium TSY]